MVLRLCDNQCLMQTRHFLFPTTTLSHFHFHLEIRQVIALPSHILAFGRQIYLGSILKFPCLLHPLFPSPHSQACTWEGGVKELSVEAPALD